jgi:hypothetical protein
VGINSVKIIERNFFFLMFPMLLNSKEGLEVVFVVDNALKIFL